MEPTSNLYSYAFIIVIFDCRVAVYSYAYHLVKSNASIEVQHQFQSKLKTPSKWLFSGREGKTLLDAVLVFGSGCKTQAEYFQKNSLRRIQFARISCTLIACFFSLPFFMNTFSVPANARHLAIPYFIFLVAQIYTLIESWRFGSELIILSQRASKTSDSVDK